MFEPFLYVVWGDAIIIQWQREESRGGSRH